MSKAQSNMQALAEHTFRFARAIREFGRGVGVGVSNGEDLRALMRSSGLVGEMLVRAQQSAHPHDYAVKIRSCLEELQVTHYWLGLLDLSGQKDLDARRLQLMQASEELAEIFRTLLRN